MFETFHFGTGLITRHLHRATSNVAVAFDATSNKYIFFETSDVSMIINEPHYYVYILFSLSDRGFYIGFTTDLKIRLSLHSSGQVYSTKNRLPVLLIHYEYFINQKDAKAREVFLKSGYGRKQLHEFLKSTLLSLKND